MEQIITLAFPFPKGEKGAGLITFAQNLCEKNGLHGTPPKMGPHATIIPPFYCTDREMMTMAILTRQMWKFSGRFMHVSTTGFGVFPPVEQFDDTGAIYIGLELDEHYREFIEKHKLGWPLPFVHPPGQTTAVDRVWVPHLSVIEGPSLHKEAEAILPHLNEYVENKRITLGEPLFFKKSKKGGETSWSPVLV